MISTQSTSLAMLFFVLATFVHLATSTQKQYVGVSTGGVGSEHGRCEPLNLAMCQSLSLYNKTRMPNFFEQTTQEEAGLEVNQFWPLVKINCSAMLGFFLCSLYVPVCLDGYDKVLPPCQSVCLAAQHGCEPVMDSYGFSWPSKLSCDKFPVNGEGDVMCMEPPKPSTTDGAKASNNNDDNLNGNSVLSGPNNGPHDKLNQFPPGNGVGDYPDVNNNDDDDDNNFIPNGFNNINRNNNNNYKGKINNIFDYDKQHPMTSDRVPNYPVSFPGPNLGIKPGDAASGVLKDIFAQWAGNCQCICKAPYVKVPSDYHPHRTVYIGNVSNCANPCHSPYFSPEELHFGIFWIGLWSVLCCISTLLTVATFLIDMDRFRYPERSIIFMSLCYLMMSIGFIVRLIVGHENVACDSKYGPPLKVGLPGLANSGAGIARSGPAESATCTIVFILIYLFGMASCVWWVILTLTWFLSAGLKWSNEAISRYAQWFHLAAWSIPSIKAVAILATSSVDGDSVSGICYVGNSQLLSLRIFVLGPLFVYLLLGSFFLLAGFISLIHIRRIMVKQQGKDTTEKLERLMVRIGIFSVLYTLPATIVIGCHFYEEQYRRHWEMSKACTHCLRAPEKPEFLVFMMKYCMMLIVGVTPILWIWSKKTLLSWSRFFRCCFSCCMRSSTQPVYQPAEAIIAIRSHNDISVSGYNNKYPVNHV